MPSRSSRSTGPPAVTFVVRPLPSPAQPYRLSCVEGKGRVAAVIGYRAISLASMKWLRGTVYDFCWRPYPSAADSYMTNPPQHDHNTEPRAEILANPS